MRRVSPDQAPERRIPRQQRAQDSCEAILSATTLILMQEGMAALSTNRISQRAGISVGTLYQYFPNKHAVLLMLGRREVERTRAMLAGMRAKADGEGPAIAALSHLLSGFSARRDERPVLCETLFCADLQTELAEAIGEAVTDGVDDPAAKFVLARAVLGVLRAVVLEGQMPETAALEHELLALARSAMGRA
jgi:AcrR family transcriptional regulator